jgi:coenzyme F420-reducing hydrogenase delta subunit
VDPFFVIKALIGGADGVLVAGCHPGDCHYKVGNLFTRRRITILKEVLQTVGVSSDRLRLEWVSASEANKFGAVVNDFVEQVRELGPNPLRGGC